MFPPSRKYGLPLIVTALELVCGTKLELGIGDLEGETVGIGEEEGEILMIGDGEGRTEGGATTEACTEAIGDGTVVDAVGVLTPS
jgi:hypothetical protein